MIIHLIELEISRQFLGQLENVNWSKPLTERNRYAAVMLLGDVRRRLHYGMNYVNLPEKVYLDVQREFEQVQSAIEVLGKLDFWGCGVVLRWRASESLRLHLSPAAHRPVGERVAAD